jgi:hypothetical protein
MLSNDEIKTILDNEIDSAIGFGGGDLSQEREDALDFYLGEAKGALAPPETADRSKVVSTDVADVVEWVLPSLLKTYMDTDEAVRFDPENQDDEKPAEQESDYVNYIFNKKNDGFLTFYSWFKDALIQKVGIVKTYWDEEDEVTTESYEGLSDQDLNLLLNDDEVEVSAHTPNEVIDEQGQVYNVHDVEITRTRTKGMARVEPVPPEEFLINADHKSITVDKARFVAHKRIMTVAELVGLGFDYKKVKDLPSYNAEDDGRDTVSDEDKANNSKDVSQKQIEVHECYILIDLKETGIATRNRFMYVKGGEILEQDEADCVPFSCITPFIMPHRWVGLSIYDKLKEIQKQKTAIWRNLLDNIYLQNNQRTAVRTGKVKLDDLLSNRPGGVVRTDKDLHPSEVMMPITVQPIGAAGFQMLEKLDQIRNERGGGGPDVAGQQIAVGGDTAHGIERIMSAKEELVGLIARTFGETGVKSMFLKLHALLMKHQDKEDTAQLRGEWVNVNPSEWRTRYGMTIQVGLGTGDRMKQQSALQGVLMNQEKLMGGGGMGLLIEPNNIYQALIDHGKSAGLDASKYYLDPAKAKPKQPEPDKDIEFMKAQLQLAQEQNSILRQKEELNAQKHKLEVVNGVNKAALDWQKERDAMKRHNDDMAVKLSELELKYMQNVPGAVI